MTLMSLMFCNWETIIFLQFCYSGWCIKIRVKIQISSIIWEDQEDCGTLVNSVSQTYEWVLLNVRMTLMYIMFLQLVSHHFSSILSFRLKYRNSCENPNFIDHLGRPRVLWYFGHLSFTNIWMSVTQRQNDIDVSHVLQLRNHHFSSILSFRLKYQNSCENSNFIDHLGRPRGLWYFGQLSFTNV